MSHQRWPSHPRENMRQRFSPWWRRGRQGEKRRIGGWLCDTRATPANGRAEPGRQTIDICVQNGRQERHPPHCTSPFTPSHVYPPLPAHPAPATALTPVELSTSLSRMPPKLFNFGTQPLTANQPILPSSSARVFRSLSRFLFGSPPLSVAGPFLSIFLVFLSVHIHVYVFFFLIPLERSFSFFFEYPLFASDERAQLFCAKR